MIDTAIELAWMFNLDDFAMEVLLPSGSTINAIYDNQAVQIDNGLSIISTSQSMFTCRTSDIAGLSQGDTVSTDDGIFTVTDTQHDGTGVSEVYVKK